MGDFLIAAHYETENYIPPKEQFLEDIEYGRALDTIVKGKIQLLDLLITSAAFPRTDNFLCRSNISVVWQLARMSS